MASPTWPELLFATLSIIGNVVSLVFFLREHWAADYCFRWCLEDMVHQDSLWPRPYPEGAAEFCVERYGTCPSLVDRSCYVFPSYMASITKDLLTGYCG